MKNALIYSIVMLPLAAIAAPNPNTLIDKSIREEIAKSISSDIVVQSVLFQNERHKDLTQDKVEELDKLWRKQREESDKYFISAVLSNPLSAYVTRLQAHSNGKFVEIFMMDNKGLNVGQSSISSDFWQGDEDKWQKTYLTGPNAVFIDEPEYNEKAKRWTAQYNVAISNPATGEVIGAATFELNLTELERLQAE